MNPHSLANLRKQVKEEGLILSGRKTVIMGAPKSGKSILASTIAKAPQIKRVFYFDLEGSIESVLHAPDMPAVVERGWALTEEEMDKVIYIPIRDTHEYPLAAETLLKCFTARDISPAKLCIKHGKVDCKKTDCTNDRIQFALSALTPEDAVILDSGSQLATSILALEMLTESYKDLRKYYGAFTIEMDAIMSGIQASQCEVIVVTHLLDIMTKPSDPKIQPALKEIAALFGSSNYSANKSTKFFGNAIMTEERNGQYLVGSSPSFKKKAKLGNRLGVRIEDYPDFNMSWLLRDLSQWPKIEKAAGPAIKVATRK
jgi:hypothetical protein